MINQYVLATKGRMEVAVQTKRSHGSQALKETASDKRQSALDNPTRMSELNSPHRQHC